MDRKPLLSLSLICCLVLLTVACSLIRSGKANKEGKSAAAQAEPAKRERGGLRAHGGSGQRMAGAEMGELCVRRKQSRLLC